jgi:hypothetical protein
MDFGIIRLRDAARLLFSKGANAIGLQAPASVPASYNFTLPSALPGSTRAVTVSSTGVIDYADLGSGGSVTSVSLALPNIFTVSGSPITTSGTLTGTLASQTANTFFAAPNGSAGTPTFRAIAWADVSALAGTSGSSFCIGNDSRLHTQNTDTGTTAVSFQLNSGASGVRLKNNGGALEIRNAADNAFANLTVNNLTVSGTQTIVNTEEVDIADNIIRLNSNFTTGSPTEDVGIEARRGSSTSASLLWIESTDRWSAGIVGSELPICRVFEQTFTNASLASGVLTITHNLGRQICEVTIADNANKAIGAPDDITYTSTTSLSIDLTSFGTLTGTWTVNVRG